MHACLPCDICHCPQLVSYPVTVLHRCLCGCQCDAAGRFLEHAVVHNNLYGTSKDAVQETLNSGKAAVLDVDVQGARQIRKAGVPALLVFVAPPSLEELERRLRGRGTETPVSMERRIQNAREEISRWALTLLVLDASAGSCAC
jgi:guanylate kinase